MCLWIKTGAAGVTHVSRRQPQVEGAAVFLAALNRQHSNCWQPLAHHQPAKHADALKHRQQLKVTTEAEDSLGEDLQNTPNNNCTWLRRSSTLFNQSALSTAFSHRCCTYKNVIFTGGGKSTISAAVMETQMTKSRENVLNVRKLTENSVKQYFWHLNMFKAKFEVVLSTSLHPKSKPNCIKFRWIFIFSQLLSVSVQIYSNSTNHFCIWRTLKVQYGILNINTSHLAIWQPQIWPKFSAEKNQYGLHSIL